jgi:cyclic 2,3-diphosphoglycerate synthetase
MNGRTLALVDGEHYPPVVRAALQRAAQDGEVVAALLAGGREKLSGEPDYGVPLERAGSGDLAAAMVETAHRYGATRVLDLSDEPVMDEDLRIHLAAHAAAVGLEYAGPDFVFHAPVLARVSAPTLAVIGTGKRIGKTAVSGYAARLLHSHGHDVVVVAMGRGGPAEPELVDGAGRELSVAELLARADAGQHAASDFLEDAALARVTTVGARRCGGGLLGVPYLSNVREAAGMAAARTDGLVLLEGSGAAVPPVHADRTLLVSTAAADSPLGRGFGVYRVLISDLAVLTMCEPPYASAEDIDHARRAVRDIQADLPVIATVLRPMPVEQVAGRVAYFTTAPAVEPLADHLRQEHSMDIVLASGELGDRERLRADLERPEARDAEAYLVEIKAAAIDVVARMAAERGIPVVFCDNRPMPLPGEPELDAALLELAEQAVGAHARP